MNWLDLAILAFVAVSVIRGAMRGAIRSVLGLAAVIIALAVSGRLYPLVSRQLGDVVPVGHQAADWLAFLLLYGLLHAVLAVIAAILGLAGKVVGPEGVPGRLAGAVLEGYRAVLLSAVLVGALLTAPHGLRLRMAPGPAAAQALRIASPMLAQLVPLFPGTVGDTVEAPQPPAAIRPL